MKIQWEILLFLFILNLSIGVTFGLAVPGTEYSGGGVIPGDAEEYESHFNSTDIAQGWQAAPFSGIPLIGDIFAGFNFLWQNIKWIVDGFPTLLNYIKDSYITDASGRLAFDVIANALRAVYALLISVFLIEFISGRIVSD